ncbi:serine hydrolase-domain-containing protein [Podospora aff. communis PSN243]|uniref:Serine hydrolase-domain-containing protein n=1 Tax=Podospora aff. communis PSN243 TaxID=3040156 RepID=A0AAV9GU50_9PEZI|nr:serine hydrolase-domain-containing protein [Podospora aff. communis PSN243]
MLNPIRVSTKPLLHAQRVFATSIKSFTAVMMGDNPAQQSAPAPALNGSDSASASASTTPLPTPSSTPKPGPQNQNRPQRPPKPAPPPKKEVKILMLHGYTQSGPLFRAKTRALEKLMAKALAPLNLVPALIYPTAPNRLSARDIPGFEVKDGEEGDEEGEIDSWAWWRRDEASGEYRFLEEGMERLVETIRDVEGGVDGVVGFSQGGSVAAVLASAMEEGRTVPEGEKWEWVRRVREANGGRALKFAVVYSGFWAVPQEMGWVYEPKVRTPTLHYLGSLDTVVEEGRSRGLVERCEEPVVVVHPGGHYVPVSKEWVMPLVGFVRKAEAPCHTRCARD